MDELIDGERMSGSLAVLPPPASLELLGSILMTFLLRYATQDYQLPSCSFRETQEVSSKSGVWRARQVEPFTSYLA